MDEKSLGKFICRADLTPAPLVGPRDSDALTATYINSRFVVCRSPCAHFATFAPESIPSYPSAPSFLTFAQLSLFSFDCADLVLISSADNLACDNIVV